MAGIITVKGVSLPTTLPKATFDGLTIPGTLGVWDAGNPKSWLSQAAPSATDHTLKNLAQAGVLDGDVSTDWTWDATRKTLVRPSATGSRIALGAPDMANGHSYGGTVWVYVPAVPTAFSTLMGRLNTPSAGADNQFALSIGADGKPRVDAVSLDTDGATLRYINVLAPGVITTGWHQLAWAMTYRGSNLTTTTLYLDGAQIATTDYVGSKLNPSTLGIALGNRHAASTAGSAAGIGYFRATLEDLTASGRTAAAFIAKDWELNRARVGL